jgi:hypothetical protein
MSISSWTATGGAWNDPALERAWDGPAIVPSKGDLTLSSSIPAFGQEFFVSPGVANLEIVGPTPQMAVGTNTSVDKSDLTFTAYSPDIGRMYKFVVSAPTLTLTGKVPANGEGFVISPENASIQLLQTYSWDDYGGIWSAAATNWDDVAFAPSAVETGQNQPDAGSLTLTGLVPTFQLSQLWYVPSGSMALTGFVPMSTSGHVFIPDSGSLSGFGGGTLWDDGTGDWASHSEAWGFGTLTPTAGVTYTFTIDAAGNLVFTPYDLSWPQIGQPKYISEIIII